MGKYRILDENLWGLKGYIDATQMTSQALIMTATLTIS